MSSLIAATDHHVGMKALYVIVTATFFAALTLYTLAKSQRIAEFLDALTNERLAAAQESSARCWISGAGSGECSVARAHGRAQVGQWSASLYLSAQRRLR